MTESSRRHAEIPQWTGGEEDNDKEDNVVGARDEREMERET